MKIAATIFKIAKTIFIALLLLLLLFVAWFAFYTYFINVDTRYAPKYSESAFSGIEKGMGKSQVLEILGEPLKKVPNSLNGTELWVYAAQGENKQANYYHRTITLTENGEVEKTYSSFYID